MTTVEKAHKRWFSITKGMFGGFIVLFIYAIVCAVSNKHMGLKGSSGYNAAVAFCCAFCVYVQRHILTKGMPANPTATERPAFRNIHILALGNIALLFISLIAVGVTYGMAKNVSDSGYSSRRLMRRKGGRGGGRGGGSSSGGGGSIEELAIGLIIGNLIGMAAFLLSGFFVWKISKAINRGEFEVPAPAGAGEAKDTTAPGVVHNEAPLPMGSPPPQQQPYPYPPQTTSPPPQQQGYYPPQAGSPPPPQGQPQFYQPTPSPAAPGQQYYPPPSAMSPGPAPGQQYYTPPPQQPYGGGPHPPPGQY